MNKDWVGMWKEAHTLCLSFSSRHIFRHVCATRISQILAPFSIPLLNTFNMLTSPFCDKSSAGSGMKPQLGCSEHMIMCCLVKAIAYLRSRWYMSVEKQWNKD
jgi:hypothetical protein